MQTMILGLVLGLAAAMVPSGLRTELIEDTETVYSCGDRTSASLKQVADEWKRGNTGMFQPASIMANHPSFSWRLPSEVKEQNSYRVLVATKPELLHEGMADVWDSGEVASSGCSGIVCGGKELSPGTVYYWTVKVAADNNGFTGYASPKSFITALKRDDEFSRYPLQKTAQKPVSVNTSKDQDLFMADFGKAAFGQLSFTVRSNGNDTLTVHLGEDAEPDGKVKRDPGASIRYAAYRVPVSKGIHTYRLALRRDTRNSAIKPHGTDVRPVLMPEYIGEVFPFRYCEVETGNSELVGMERAMVHYAWDENASFFHSSDSVLNKIWDLCKYSILATSFAGVYVDGDRERIPYEADALINQLSHYCVDDEFTIARHSVDYLCRNATWPTEWILQAPIMAWNDYLYTGDASLLQKNYEILKARTLTALKEENGLISTATGKQTKELLRSCGYYGESIRDIVDWPQSGALGIGKEKPGEADGYELLEYNTVVNAYHYHALGIMAKVAGMLGHEDDARFYANEAIRVKEAVNNLLLDRKRGYYRDGIGSGHFSLHASMFPMEFGMVPDKYKPDVLEHLRSRGMACSVYGSQFLLDALYEGGMDNYALELLTSKGERSWWNMIKVGSTVTLEGWDRQFKPNLDWNHAWGAAPANIIARKLMGIEPVEPGWRRLKIQPRPGVLEHASIKVPTILGPVKSSFRQLEGMFSMDIEIPSGAIAQVTVPFKGKKYRLEIDGSQVRGTRKKDGIEVELHPGRHSLILNHI